MSFWDKLKPVVQEPAPTRAALGPEGRSLLLEWGDSAPTEIPARALRQACPCAGCVDETTGKRTLDVNSVPVDMRITAFSTVGNYALSFVFADSHSTGIFRFGYLDEVARAAPR